jgi:hypothetical protein
LASSDRSSPLPYSPANPPEPGSEQISRATWDEFYRLAIILQNIQSPSALSVKCEEGIEVQATTVWDRLFNEGVAYSWQNPEGTLDILTGVWTCPEEGLYSIDITLEASPFPSPATKEYTASLQTTYHPLSGPNQVFLSQNGGIDTQALRVSGHFLTPIYRGDQFWFDADLTHATKTGTVQCKAFLNILREGRIK